MAGVVVLVVVDVDVVSFQLMVDTRLTVSSGGGRERERPIH